MRTNHQPIFTLFASLVLASCGGGGGNSNVDAPTGLDGSAQSDAAPDAGSGSGSGAPVTVAYAVAGVPLAGVTVYFQNADQSLAGTATTDANGSASQTMGSGGYVTAVLGRAGSAATTIYTVETLANVQPGDALHLGGATASLTAANMTITAPDSAGATTYTLYTTCGTGTLTQSLTTTVSGSASLAGCGADTDMLVVTNGSTPKASWNPNIVVTASGSATLSAPYVALGSLAMSITGVPAGVTSISAASELETANGLSDPTSGSGAVSGGSATVTLSRPVTTGTGMYNAITMTPQTRFVDEIDELDATGSAYTLDLGSNLMPQFAAAPVIDTSTHQVTWTETNVGTVTPEIAEAVVTATRGTTTWNWTVVQARAGLNVQMPTLPTDVFDFTIASTDTAHVETLGDAMTPVGWDALRPLFFANFNTASVLSTGTRVLSQRYSAPAN